ncbi:unnamed protein product [Phaeothamnion confervicola]
MEEGGDRGRRASSSAGGPATAAPALPARALERKMSSRGKMVHRRGSSSGKQSSGDMAAAAVQASAGGDARNRPRKASEPQSVVQAVGQEVMSPLRITDKFNSSRGGGAYIRGEMLTPSPPANWHPTPLFQSKSGGMHLGATGEVDRAPLDALAGAEGDPEAGATTKKDERNNHYINYLTVTITHLVIAYALGIQIYKIVMDALDSGVYITCIALAWYPAAYVFMLFSIDYLVAQIIYSLGPVAHMQQNSKYFSAVPCPRPDVLPKITIQMPVYKESLPETILPTIQSLTTAILHYKKVGGEANLLVCDDGLQLISQEERDARLYAYKKHGVSYVARPENSKRERKGLFKKASNMNYSLNVALRVEELCDREGASDPVAALELVKAEFAHEFLGAGDVRIGEVILLVDSDTRIPEDCLAKVSGEFALYGEVGFLQCKSTAIRINDNYWENMISHFTNDVYAVGIAMAVSSGDPAPLVGHNVFIRWAAIRDCSQVDPDDGERKFWSEKHVSEDFDLALRLQAHGFVGRYCTYTGNGFQEGVSLTAADEVIRLRKYAYGSCEIMLNKFVDWPCSGPVTSMFRRYLFASGVPGPAKIRMIAYLSTYVAMAFSFYGIVGYLAVWIEAPEVLKYLVNPFDILITVCFVFGALSVFGAAMITYRGGTGAKVGIFRAFLEQIKNAPIMLLFFSHVLFHLTVVCFRYFFSMSVQWTASVKESDHLDFFTEVKNTFKRYVGMYLTMLFFAGVVAAAIWYFQLSWDVRIFVAPAVYIGTHLFGPFLLNPIIMRGYY